MEDHHCGREKVGVLLQPVCDIQIRETPSAGRVVTGNDPKHEGRLPSEERERMKAPCFFPTGSTNFSIDRKGTRTNDERWDPTNR